MSKIVLIDGNNLVFRSYYATLYSGASMQTSDGIKTNAVYGFVNMINKIFKEENPTHVLIAFDKGKTFRHEKYDSYKDGRNETPDDLKNQFKIVKELLPLMGIKYMEIDNYEADDIIGTISKMIDASKHEGLIVSSDKDLLQLISDKVTVKLLKSSGHILYDRETFKTDYGFEPINIIDLKAIMGDSSDNIKGVKGIGEKGASKLICEYTTLENVYENIEQIKGATKKKLIDEKKNAFESKELVTIYNYIDLNINLDDLIVKNPKDELEEKFLELEFSSLRFMRSSKKEEKIENIEVISDIFTLNSNSAFYIETIAQNYHVSEIVGVSIYNDTQKIFTDIETFVKSFEKNKDKLCFTYDLKKSIVLLNRFGINLPKTIEDISIIGYLLNYNVKNDVGYLAIAFGIDIEEDNHIYKKCKKIEDVSIYKVKNNSIKKSKFIFDITSTLKEDLKSQNVSSLYEDMELPLVHVLADMEISGITIDKEILKNLELDLKEKVNQLDKNIQDIAGIEFNVASPKQLGEVLFNHLKIDYPKRKKGSYSTDKEVLDKIYYKHEIVPFILDYRMYYKLYTSYAIGLGNYIMDDGKIHTIYNQIQTRTGRLSSNEPNLQTIPIRTDYGKNFRKIFIPSKDNIIISSDYSQIELRIFAHMANAEKLIDAFNNDIDVHTKTASEIYNISIDEVTSNQRRNAKAVNFGILYGISDFGLSRDLKISVYEAKTFIENYFKTFPGIKSYMKNVINQAYQSNITETLYGRKRVIEELSNPNKMIRNMGERMALNTPIQGTSADIIKDAMVKIYDKFNKMNLKSKMILQIHDELIFDVIKDEKEKLVEIINDVMTNIIDLKVSLKIDTNSGKSLYESK
ncbi:MAG: DNA polymerase I [Bacilli bacterium]